MYSSVIESVTPREHSHINISSMIRGSSKYHFFVDICEYIILSNESTTSSMFTTVQEKRRFVVRDFEVACSWNVVRLKTRGQKSLEVGLKRI